MTTLHQKQDTYNVMKKYIEEMEDFFGGDEERFETHKEYENVKHIEDCEYTLRPMKNYIEEMEEFFGGDEERFQTHEEYEKVKDIVDKIFVELNK